MRFDVKVKVLTPLHIGSGGKLLRNYDYVGREGQTYRLNQEALLERALGQSGTGSSEFDRVLSGVPPAQLLDETDFGHPALFHYIVSGEPRSAASGSELLEQIKDAWDRPYLPGSSLKGALRTVLAWQLIQKGLVRPNLRNLGDGRERAGQPIERQIFGPDQNRDLLRALVVRDSQPVDSDRLMVLNAHVKGRGDSSLPIELEAVSPDTVFALQITLDDHLLMDLIEKLGHAQEVVESLRGFTTWGRNFARHRIKSELDYLGNRRDMDRTAGFYRWLGQQLTQWKGTQTFPLQVGWGTGWDSKTLGSHLRADSALFDDLVEKRIRPRGWKRGMPFPQSRHLDDKGRPLGWLEITAKGVA